MILLRSFCFSLLLLATAPTSRCLLSNRALAFTTRTRTRTASPRRLDSQLVRASRLFTTRNLLFNVEQVESYLIDSLFAGPQQDKNRRQINNDDDPNKELARFENLVCAPPVEDVAPAPAGVDVDDGEEPASIRDATISAHKSLTRYLELWVFQLEKEAPKQITTPIVSSQFRDTSTTTTTSSDCESSYSSILALSSSMKIKFRPRKRYLSAKEQKGLEKGVIPDRKGGKVDAWSPGGIELIVQTTTRTTDMTTIDQNAMPQLQLVAKRCDIDRDTIIKHSSERAIIRRLEEAVRIWKKVRAMPNNY